ncbi:MAG TPA: pyridoxamine 5'-phosphate oxidase family protein [Solirubrobacteraceae bacterium]|nr:pyridoxamine 5'-phosphate oxidase family protein [Solirubrobacteraceae bacterium]
MHETPDDLAALQALIDASYAAAGPHLLAIHEPQRRLTAEQLCAKLTGMRLLTLATVTRDCRPVAGPVDGIFFRGHFYFGSADNSVRFRHIRARPQVSATHLPSEELAVTVHGHAVPIDIAAPDHAAFRQALLEVYLPMYGEGWEQEFLEAEAPAYARIDAQRMFTFFMPAS